MIATRAVGRSIAAADTPIFRSSLLSVGTTRLDKLCSLETGATHGLAGKLRDPHHGETQCGRSAHCTACAPPLVLLSLFRKLQPISRKLEPRVFVNRMESLCCHLTALLSL